MPLPDLQRFPIPPSSTLYVLDRVTIKGVVLPLDRPIEAGTELDIEKRKSPGSDYSGYVSHGRDSVPIRIALRLWRDVWNKKDWFADYEQIRDSLIPRYLSRRNAIPVFHPFLDIEGINEIVFTKRSIPVPSGRGHFFIVTLEGFNPKTLRLASATGAGGANAALEQDTSLVTAADREGQSRVVERNKQAAVAPAARRNTKNYTGPAANNVGRGTRNTGGR